MSDVSFEEPTEQKVERPDLDPSFLEYLEKARDLCTTVETSGQDDVGDRMILYTNGRTSFGIVLTETTDSIFVAHPIIMGTEDGELTGRPMIPYEVARIPKSAVWLISRPLDSHRVVYLQFLLEGMEKIPTILTGKRLAAAHEFVTNYRKRLSGRKVGSSVGEGSHDEAEGGWPNPTHYKSHLKH